MYFDVAGVVTPQSITVTSPNGGETFVVGNSPENVTPIPVSWNSSGFENLPETSLWIGLISESGVRCNIGTISSYDKSFNIGMFLDYSGCIAKGGGPTLSAGKYQVFVSNNSGESTQCPVGYICSEPFDTVKDISDGYFTISSNNPASLSDVQVTSLSTGATVTQLEKGKNAVIRWTQKNISNPVTVALYRFDSGVWNKAANIITTVPTSGASESQSFNWNVRVLSISLLNTDPSRYCVGASASYEVSFIDPVQRYPVLSGLTGPKTLRVGETGQWGLLAIDPDGGLVSVSVTGSHQRELPTPRKLRVVSTLTRTLRLGQVLSSSTPQTVQGSRPLPARVLS